MSVRTQFQLALKIGRDGALTNLIADQALSGIFDSLLKGDGGEIVLAPGAVNVAVSMGDIADGRVFLIVSSGEIQAAFSASLGIPATLVSGAGTYNTGFVVDVVWGYVVDGVTVPVTFTSADQTRAQVINRINAAAMLAGLDYIPCEADAAPSAIVIHGKDPTEAGAVEIPSALAAIGFPAPVSAAGTNPGAGAAPLELRRPVSPDATTSDSFPTFLMGTIRAGGLVLNNLSSTESVRVYVAVAGDIDTTYGGC